MEEKKKKNRKILLIIVAVVLGLGIVAILFADLGSFFQGKMKFNKKNVKVDNGIGGGFVIEEEIQSKSAKEKFINVPMSEVGSVLGGGSVMEEEEEEEIQSRPKVESGIGVEGSFIKEYLDLEWGVNLGNY